MGDPFGGESITLFVDVSSYVSGGLRVTVISRHAEPVRQPGGNDQAASCWQKCIHSGNQCHSSGVTFGTFCTLAEEGL
jgi:hypothetical protein